MTAEPLKTLFHPFEAEAVALPQGGRALFLGAEPGFRLPAGWGAEMDTVQGFRPHFRALEAAGLSVTPRPEGDGYVTALVLARRHRGQNELRVADAIERTAPGAMIVVAGSKDDGIASLRRRVGDLVAIEASLPKHHGVAFWFRRPAGSDAASALRAAHPPVPVEGRFSTAPGMFSHDRIDTGSRMLAEALPADLAGEIADFCAGWGYLSAQAAQRCPGIRALDLFEADFESLEAAKGNVSLPSSEPRFFWHDLLREPVEGRYHAILMNPPFHQGRAAEPELGAGMIRVAARALRQGGRLFMVANRRLPYEPVLQEGFSGWSELTGDSAFKVLAARR